MELRIEKINWRSGYRSAVDAEVAYKEIERIRKRGGGSVVPEDVVESAKDKKSPLHASFEWNNRVAAERYRVEQARLLLRSIEVTYSENDTVLAPVRVYSVQRVTRDDNTSHNVYRSTEEMMGDTEGRIQLLTVVLTQLASIRKKYAALQELSAIFREIDNALEQVEI